MLVSDNMSSAVCGVFIVFSISVEGYFPRC